MKIKNELVETKRADVVKAGQTRATQDMELIVLIIKAPLAVGSSEGDEYSAVILKNGEDGEFEFEIDNEYQAESSEKIKELYPVYVDSTLTLKEFHK